jgi:4-amino-4-deoxy-L-arabinose transferase-like glycosyltransferase
LTEVITVFFLTLAFAYLAWKKERLKEVKTIHYLILILGLLTLVKPLFYLPFLGVVFIILPIFYFKQYQSKPRHLIRLLLVLLPVILQLGIMKVKHNEMTISTIGSITFKNYYFLRGVAAIEEMELEDAALFIEDYSSADQQAYIMDHKTEFYELLTSSIEENIRSGSIYLIMTNKNEGWAQYMYNTNDYYYSFHKFFLFLFIPILIALLYFKDYSSFVLIAFPGLIVLYILITSGISYWQGDRLVLPAIGIWMSLYVFMGYTVFMLGKRIVGRLGA